MMSNSQIKSAVESVETDVCEFKSSFNAAVIESLVAFANTGGGAVLVGVEDNGLPVGTLNIGNETVVNWVNEIKTKTQPALVPNVSVEEIQGAPVVRLSVPEYPVKPVAVRGRYYKRVGNSNHQMSLVEIANLHLQSINLSWDFYTDPQHSIETLSLDKVNRFIQQLSSLRQTQVQDDPLTVLRKYEMLRDNQLTFGAFLMFCERASLVATIEAGRFDSETIIRDSITIRDDLFSEVDACMAFITKHTSKRYVITGKPQRDEVWEYPQDAVREIVINMIVHRDYQSSIDSTIKIHNDRIEFFNPGGLPNGVTLEAILSGVNPSRPRNRLIASIFREAGIIEKYGSGIRRVHSILKDAGAPNPQFADLAGVFKVTLFPIGVTQIGEQKVGALSGALSGALNKSILKMVIEHPGVQRHVLVDTLDVPSRTVDRYIKELIMAGEIERRGSRKTGGYYRVEKT